MNKEYVEDSNKNRCYVNYFGSIEAAQKALDSLKDCKNCTNCSGCYCCYSCSSCSDCSGCSGCFHCSRCYDCYGCSRCTGCAICSNCSDCSGCSGCSGCFNCSDCYDLKYIGKCLKPSSFVPKIENIDKAIYEACSQPNALNMNDWHTCETTHCRAGWVVTLAGQAGKELELFHNYF